MILSSNASNSPQVVNLSGTGAQGIVNLSPSSLNFGSILVNTSSSTQTVTFTNTGVVPIWVTAANLSGSFSNAGTGTCPAAPFPLWFSASCTFDLLFHPTASGAANGQLTIISNASNSPQSVALSGTGVQGLASLTPPVPTFPFEPVGTHAPLVTITLTNTGTYNLTLSGINLSAGDFVNAGTGTCTATSVLATSANCTIKVVFTPTASGTRTATLTVTSNGSNSPTTLGLSGIGEKNVITNGGMEIDAVAPIKIPDGWTAVNMTVGSTTDGLTTSFFHSGTKSMRIVGLTGITKTLTQNITDTGSINLPLCLTLWVKGSAVSTTGSYQAVVQLYIGTSLKKTFTFTLPTGTYGFTQKTFNMTSTVAYTKISVQFLSSKLTGSSMWIDDVSLVHP
jgi:hypothetical protein